MIDEPSHVHPNRPQGPNVRAYLVIQIEERMVVWDTSCGLPVDDPEVTVVVLPQTVKTTCVDNWETRPSAFWPVLGSLSMPISGLLIAGVDRKSTRLNSSHVEISYA